MISYISHTAVPSGPHSGPRGRFGRTTEKLVNINYHSRKFPALPLRGSVQHVQLTHNLHEPVSDLQISSRQLTSCPTTRWHCTRPQAACTIPLRRQARTSIRTAGQARGAPSKRTARIATRVDLQLLEEASGRRSSMCLGSSEFRLSVPSRVTRKEEPYIDCF